MEWLRLLFVHMSLCSPAQDWYEKRSIIHFCLESVHRDRRWLGSKTLSSHFSSHHLFSPCLLCHWTFPLTSLTSLSHFYRFMVLPPESSTPWSVWKAHCRERCWRLFRLKIRMFAILLSLSTLCTPQSSHFLSFGFFDIVFYNPFFWFFSFTYQHCWSRSPGRNLWPPGLLPSAAYGLLWRILKADRETTV